ncbi:MAG: cytochrome c1 [Hyphomonadaceae bacterium]
MLKRIIIALAFAAAPAAFAEEAPHAPAQNWSFEGPFGTYDRGAVQRGFLVYSQVCASCHALDHLSYRNLGEAGGPFTAYRVMNEETGQEEITLGLHGGHGGHLVPPTENPYVQAIAAAAMIRDIDRETGEATERPGRAADRFRAPYANAAAAAAANGGAAPPDLSVMALARRNGADYIHGLLTGYTEAPAGAEIVEGKHYNRYFPGHWISMPPPLPQAGLVTYNDGTEATVDQMASDVAHFLQWAADPHMERRNALGVQVLIFLVVLSVLVYLAYRQVWRGVKH